MLRLGAREAAILIINACLMGLAGEAGIDSAQFYHPGKDLKEGTTSLNKFPIPTPTAQCVEHVFQQHISPDSMNAWDRVFVCPNPINPDSSTCIYALLEEAILDPACTLRTVSGTCLQWRTQSIPANLQNQSE